MFQKRKTQPVVFGGPSLVLTRRLYSSRSPHFLSASVSTKAIYRSVGLRFPYLVGGRSRGDQPMDEAIPLKIRRVTKACDLCRKRKARCDGDPSSNKGCTLCTNTGVSCVFTRFARKRGHESSQARELESRIIELEGIIRLIAPGIDIDQEIDDLAGSDSPGGSRTLLRPSDSAFRRGGDTFLRPSAGSTSAFSHPSHNVPNPQSHEETKPDLSYSTSSGSGNSCAIVTPPGAATSPYSSSSSKDPRGTGLEGRPTTSRSPYHTELSFTEGSEISIGLELAHAWKKEVQPQATRRNSRQVNPAEYQGSFTKPMRDKLATRVSPQDLWFPPDDLLASLVDLYFTRFNIILPLLHRPTFEAQLEQKLHWKDPSFAAVVLLVCANGSRFSDDTRVMPYYAEDIPPESREFDAGILFYRQVDVCSMGVFPVDVLFEHQIMTLGAMYLTIANPSAVLVTTGVGLRLSMQRGIHRNAWQGEANTHNKTLNDEMWRRVFWCSYVLDVLFSTFYGRPTSVLTDQYDLPPPVPMEGEDFLAVTGFRHFTKLCEILTEITRTMSTSPTAMDPRIWLLLLNRSPGSRNVAKFIYHFSQILVRRQYAMVPGAGEPGKSLFEDSRKVCLHSARSNATMLGHYISINRKPFPWLVPSTRETVVALVMSGLRLFRSNPQQSEENQDRLLQNCMDLLQLVSRVGVHVADMANMLRELAAPIGASPSPSPSP
ncbi:hypothetical protein OPQ81_010258 [Rhizoctonia solani]|nr:hypothetical protein OPQ81_010258 [Rhizoctonia solani]